MTTPTAGATPTHQPAKGEHDIICFIVKLFVEQVIKSQQNILPPHLRAEKLLDGRNQPRPLPSPHLMDEPLRVITHLITSCITNKLTKGLDY